MKILVVTALVTLSLVGTAVGRTWRVPVNVPTIPVAMDSASSGDTILVQAGVHYLETLYVTNGVVLTSESGPLETEITPIPYTWPNHGAFWCVGLTDYTEISGFYIHGYIEGFYWDGSSNIWVSDSDDVCIRNNITPTIKIIIPFFRIVLAISNSIRSLAIIT